MVRGAMKSPLCQFFIHPDGAASCPSRRTVASCVISTDHEPGDMQIKGHANQEVRLGLVLRESKRLLARLALNVIDARQYASDLQDNIQETSDALRALRKQHGAWSAGGHGIGTSGQRLKTY